MRKPSALVGTGGGASRTGQEMALRGLRVVELAGLAPAPFAGMILAGEAALKPALAQLSNSNLS